MTRPGRAGRMGRMSMDPERTRAARRFLPAALIVGAALLAYWPVFRAGFVWDDDKFLTENPLIRASDGLRRFWFTAEPPDYFPLTSSMLWFEWRLWGPHAFGYHVVNVLLHAASAVLLWRALLRLKVPGAWLAGLLFAVHPVAVESVAWITERKNTLPMVFYLASILAFLRFEDGCSHHDDSFHHDDTTSTTHGTPLYLLSLVLFLLALLAKTSVVMLPAVLLLCAWWRRGKVAARDLLRTVPFFALALALGLVTVWFQYHSDIAGEVVRTDSLAARAAGAGWAIWFYLYKALLPVNLCFCYPRWTTSASLPAFVPGLLFLAMLLLFAAFRRILGPAAALRARVLRAGAAAGAGVPEHLFHALLAGRGPLAIHGADRRGVAGRRIAGVGHGATGLVADGCEGGRRRAGRGLRRTHLPADPHLP